MSMTISAEEAIPVGSPRRRAASCSARDRLVHDERAFAGGPAARPMPLDAPVMTTHAAGQIASHGGACTRRPSAGRTARMTKQMEDLRPLAGHSPEQERPLGGYAVLMGLFATAAAGFSAWFRGSGRDLPDRMSAADLALVTVATHKASRLVSKDRVTSAVRAPFTRYQYDDG